MMQKLQKGKKRLQKEIYLDTKPLQSEPGLVTHVRTYIFLKFILPLFMNDRTICFFGYFQK